MRRLLSTITFAAVLLVASASTAAAQFSGEGAYGEVNDKIITNTGFIVIFAFPVFLLIMSIIQWKLEKRKERRKAAAKAANGDGRWNGGW